ncbi:MAG: hypothetical protein Q8807_03865, partial ['Waltheria sp.' little leaf phytoplasma]|nr:hypothetical protein ['Waltheria sp.' little leaf phytoplasma]
MVQVFYCNAVPGTNKRTGARRIQSLVRGVEVTVDNETLEKMFNMPDDGLDCTTVSYTDEAYLDDRYYVKLNTGAMPLQERIMYAILTGIRPTRSGASKCNSEDVFFMSCVMNKRRIRLPTFIINDMECIAMRKTDYLHYGLLLSRIFEYYEVPLEDTSAFAPDPKSTV